MGTNGSQHGLGWMIHTDIRADEKPMKIKQAVDYLEDHIKKTGHKIKMRTTVSLALK